MKRNCKKWIKTYKMFQYYHSSISVTLINGTKADSHPCPKDGCCSRGPGQDNIADKGEFRG